MADTDTHVFIRGNPYFSHPFLSALKDLFPPFPLFPPVLLVPPVGKAYMPWAVETSTAMVLEASEIEERNHISFWDAMTVAAAQRARAVRIFTEDLNHGQKIEGIFIQNPFSA